MQFSVIIWNGHFLATISVLCTKEMDRPKKITFFSFISLQHCKYLLKDVVWGKSDKKEICCLVAINNTAGLDAESSFHIPESVQLDIRTAWPCTKPNSPRVVEFARSVFAACPVDGSGFCVSGVTEWPSRLVAKARGLRRGQLSTRNKVLVRYLAVLLRTCTTLLAVRFWGSLRDFAVLRQEAGFC